MKTAFLVVLFAVLGGCDWQQDQAGSVTGPGISVHCDAAVPGGDTTTKVVCPGASEQVKGAK